MRVGFNNRWTRNQEKRAHYLAILRIRPRASHEQSGHTLALQPFRRSRSIVQRGKARRTLNLHGGAQLEPPPHVGNPPDRARPHEPGLPFCVGAVHGSPGLHERMCR